MNHVNSSCSTLDFAKQAQPPGSTIGHGLCSFPAILRGLRDQATLNAYPALDRAWRALPHNGGAPPGFNTASRQEGLLKHLSMSSMRYDALICSRSTASSLYFRPE